MTMSDRFRALHETGLFVMPNAWDVGSARLLEYLGFPAIATTSSGHAASLGRLDQRVRRDELLAHTEQLAGAIGIPLSVDAEGGFPDDPGGVARTVELIAATGAAGCSIEDYHASDGLLSADLATERVAEAVRAAAGTGLVITARAENHLYGVDDLDGTIARLAAYRDAGADVVYAPGLTEIADIERVVRSVAVPVNVLAVSGVPPTAELERADVRRVSTGGSLAWVAYGALAAAGGELLDAGTTSYLDGALDPTERDAALG